MRLKLFFVSDLEVLFEIKPPLSERITHDINMVFLEVHGVKNRRTHEFPEELYRRAMDSLSQTTIEEIKNEPIIRAYRDFYWKVCKIDPTKIRPSAEALARRVLRKKPLPNINCIVNSYNIASIISRISIGAYDYDTLKLPLVVRNAENKEKFLGIGMSKPVILNEEMLILADKYGPINILPYRDADRTKVNLETKNILFVGTGVQGISTNDVKKGIILAGKLVTEFCGGEIGKIYEYCWKSKK